MKHYYSILVCILWVATANSQYKASITIDASKTGATVSPALHGVFFEEISHGGEGGLYAELIQNRGFEESVLPHGTSLIDGFIVPDKSPHYNLPNNQVSDWKLEWPLKSKWPAWRLLKEDESISLTLTNEHPLNKATPNALQVTINQPSTNGLVNEGFWGINTVKGETYNLSFYIRTDKQFHGPVVASLQSNNGTVLASHTFTTVTNSDWKKYTCALVPAQTDGSARFVLSFGSKGTVWLDFVSLFPAKTFMNRKNGLRNDLAQYIANLHPAFVRWPGGCFVEGISVANSPDWQTSIGTVEQRAATYSPWGYWSSNGFGYHEYLQFCEDIKAEALYVFNIGVSCEYRSGNYVPDTQVDSVISHVLDGIEYAIGSVTSKWGKLRAANGHPKPFPLKYVEVGNEQHGPRYAARYNIFYNAIKSKYPQLKLIASMGIGDVNRHTLDSMKKVDIADEHAYKPAFWAMRNTDHFDKYKRGNWDMYVGEYATNSGVGAGNMTAALSDAVYIMSMERNSDLVTMSSYAPLFVNVNDVDWPVNLINFNASKSFARISYYAIKMFADNRASVNWPLTTTVTPPAIQKSLFAGSIGLATWDTQTEYADIQIIQNNKTVYTSDFKNRAGEWQLTRGEWKVTDSSLTQTAMGEQRLAWLKDRSFDTYTLKLKARRLSGYNAFIIPFAVTNDSVQLRAHIGSWLNSHCVFERVTDAFDVTGITNQFTLEKPIETNRWYDITIEVGVDQVDCYLDGKLLMTYREPPKFFAIAGKDASTGDIILKVVNASAEACTTNITLDNIQTIQPEATLITLQAPDGNAENSLEHPQQYIPVVQKISGISRSSDFTFQPYSINVVRVHTR